MLGSFVYWVLSVLTAPLFVSDENLNILLSFAKEYLMPDLMERCEHFLQEKSNKLGPSDPEHLNLLVIASTHNLSGLARVLIPKVANFSVGDIEKYYGIIKPSLLMCVQGVMLRRYVPGMSGGPLVRHHVTKPVKYTYCASCGRKDKCGPCAFCTGVLCAECAAGYVCGSEKPKLCHYCGAKNCTCFPKLAEKHLNSNC